MQKLKIIKETYVDENGKIYEIWTDNKTWLRELKKLLPKGVVHEEN